MPFFLMSWDFPFFFWGDANGKFTYVPKYKPGISKLDYTNRHLSNSIKFPVNLSPVQVDRIDRPFSRTFAQRLDLTMICLPKHCTKVNQTFNFTYLLELEAIRRFSSNIKYLIE